MAETPFSRYLIIMLSINMILFLVQTAIVTTNPDGPVFFDVGNSPAGQFLDSSNGLVINASEVGLDVEEPVEAESTNVFTDAFKKIKQWFSKLDRNFGLFTGMLGQPYGFLKGIGVPQAICTAFGVIWYGLMALLVAGIIGGRNT